MSLTKMQNKAGHVALVEDFQKAEFLAAGFAEASESGKVIGNDSKPSEPEKSEKGKK